MVRHGKITKCFHAVGKILVRKNIIKGREEELLDL